MNDEVEKWKSKYLNSLDEFEQTEKRWNDLLGLMQRAVAKVSIAAQGQFAGLDRQLDELRKITRDDAEREKLDETITNLEHQTLKLDAIREQHSERMLQSLTSLSKQLLPFAKDSSLRKQLKQYDKKLQKQIADTQQRVELLGEISQLQAEVFKGLSDTLGEATNVAGGSLWQRLFGDANKSDNPHTETPPLPRYSSPKEQESAQHADEVEIAKTPEFSRISERISEVFFTLLQQLEISEAQQAEVKALRAQLEKGLNWYELVPALETLSIIIVSTFDRDQRDFEYFLKSLDDRLSTVQRYLLDSQASQKSVFESSRNMDEKVRDHVKALNENVDDATDLAHLKNSVRNNLDAIVSSLDQYQKQQNQQELSLTEQLSELVQRVSMMEQESGSVQQKLEEQRQKLLLDNLTQLPNREAYEQRLAQEYERWKRYRRPLSMVIGDVDLFKQVNDSYGHLAGDKVLRVIAKTLVTRLRKTDFVGRFGGEEFVILMPETSIDQALGTMEQVREAISKCPFHFRDEPLEITMSFGICEFSDEDAPEQVFERADKALYQAKELGRNQCVKAVPAA